MSALTLALLLSASPLDPRDPDFFAPPPSRPDWTQFAIPALENTALSLVLMAFSNLVTREPFAVISRESVERNLDPRRWTFDVDYYVTNQFGHPYQGGWYFQSARSVGFDFWWSALSATVFSLVWELFFEIEPPSVNDQITTPMGGAMLGEVMHRSSLRLRRAGGPKWLTLLGATLLDPVGALNAALLGEPSAVDEPLEPMFVRWQLGATAGAVVDRADGLPADRMPPQVLVAVQLVSGPPWDERTRYRGAFSSFELRADLSFPFKVVGNLFIRGLLQGQPFSARRGSLRGVWGLFGAYDYAAPAIVRASAVGLGPGVSLQVEPGAGWYLQVSSLVAGSPFVAAGQLREIDPDQGRDYHVGPGLQLVADLRLFRPRTLLVELIVRNWLVAGVYAAPVGFEALTSVMLGAHVPVWRWLGIGAEGTLTDRRATGELRGLEHDTGLSVRVMISVLSEPHFGVGGISAQDSR